MADNVKNINLEELLMFELENMNLQVIQIEKQKNKILKNFYYLGLDNVCIALENKFEQHHNVFKQQINNLKKDDYRGVIDAYQKYINFVWDELFNVVESFNDFSEYYINNDVKKKVYK